MSTKYSTQEILHDDMLAVPEKLRKKIDGTEEEYDDDEPTQVTKLLEELEECATEASEEATKTERTARSVRRLTRNPKSYPVLKAVVLSEPPLSEGESK